jgi:hypothetical protein
MEREAIEKFFQEHAHVEVTFTKVDGTVRTMPCTLNEALIPPAPAPDLTKPPRVKKFNPAVMSVFCTDKQEWRSFRIENVISITPKE